MNLILTDYELCLKQIENLMSGSVEKRRISRLENTKLRKEALDVLHVIQIQTLKKWRAHKNSDLKEGNQSLLMLLLLVNALSGGLKGTG
jgi:phosphoenolpyruvate carboxylase